MVSLSAVLVRLGIDFENPARVWWDEGGRELWESIAESADASKVVVDQSIAQSWLQEASKLPGWNDGPEYAPHPVRLSDVDPDDVDL
jgi:hypothetical protein